MPESIQKAHPFPAIMDALNNRIPKSVRFVLSVIGLITCVVFMKLELVTWTNNPALFSLVMVFGYMYLLDVSLHLLRVTKVLKK